MSKERDEMINHIISECSKLAQKEYKTRHEWVGKVIHYELCKKLKFDHTNKWYIYLLYCGKEEIHSEIESIIYKLKWCSSTNIISLAL